MYQKSSLYIKETIVLNRRNGVTFCYILVACQFLFRRCLFQINLNQTVGMLDFELYFGFKTIYLLLIAIKKRIGAFQGFEKLARRFESVFALFVMSESKK